MKIYTRVNIEWDDELQQYVEVSSESYEYGGEVAEAKGSESTNTVTNSDPWKGQQPYLTDLFAKAQDLYNQGNPDTSASRDLSEQTVQSYRDAAGTLDPYIQSILSANQGYATGDLLNPNSNPAFQDYLNLSNQAISTNFAENILPQLTGGAAQVGGIGGSRQGIAQSNAAGKTVDAIQRNTAGLTDAAYGRGLSATMQAQSLVPLLSQLGLLPANTLGQAAQLQYGLDTEDQRMDAARLSSYKDIVNGSYGGTTSSYGPGMETGGTAGALGLGTAAYAMGANPYWTAAWAVAGYFS